MSAAVELVFVASGLFELGGLRPLLRGPAAILKDLTQRKLPAPSWRPVSCTPIKKTQYKQSKDKLDFVHNKRQVC